MAILKVNPTRASLLKLKKELKTAKRGHKLLKDKRDGLMKKFMEIIHDTRQLRESVEERLGDAFLSYTKANASTPKKILDTALLTPSTEVHLDANTENIMSVSVPKFHIEKTGSAISYGTLSTSGNLDNAIQKFDDVFADLIRLTELEKAVESMAIEIEKTRRRVSSLENVMIPNLNETIKFISQRLEEQARDTVVSTMRIKAMIEEKDN